MISYKINSSVNNQVVALLLSYESITVAKYAYTVKSVISGTV